MFTICDYVFNSRFYLVYVSLFVIAIWREKRWWWWDVYQESASREVKLSSNTKLLRYVKKMQIFVPVYFTARLCNFGWQLLNSKASF